MALQGIDGAIVEVEADISAGLAAFILIGLPDAALGQAKDRVRVAAGRMGCAIASKRVVVNLSPAALPKHGSGFDLAIAMATLAADGLVSPESVASVAHLGELGLDGRLRPIAGVLPAVHAAARAGVETVMVPSGNAEEASLVPGVRVVAAPSLREAAIWHGAELEAEPVEPIPAPALDAEERAPTGDLADVVGHREAIEALVVAAAGGHNLFMVGPPGAGKTMLASRLPGILPELGEAAAIEVASLRSLAGLPVAGRLPRQPPFEAPHHTATTASIIGGGSTQLRPGAAARASHGVLFLDEAPEFVRSTLDSLRQPLESGEITVHRAAAVARFPASFQLVMAANPCPCGQPDGDDSCTCSPFARRRYLARLSGPLMDRIDLQLRVPRVTPAQLRLAEESERLSSAAAREAVLAARMRAAERLAGSGLDRNAQLPSAWLQREGRPEREAQAVLERAFERGLLSMRGRDRVLRVAWTIADLDGVDRPGVDQLGRALTMRRAAA